MECEQISVIWNTDYKYVTIIKTSYWQIKHCSSNKNVVDVIFSGNIRLLCSCISGVRMRSMA